VVSGLMFLELITGRHDLRARSLFGITYNHFFFVNIDRDTVDGCHRMFVAAGWEIYCTGEIVG